jgi:hypothetical protein
LIIFTLPAVSEDGIISALQVLEEIAALGQRLGM